MTELQGEPLLLLDRGFASRAWFAAACQLAQVQPRVLLESTAPQTLVALARTGRGIAVVPSSVGVPREGVRVAALLHRGVPIGRWAVAAWDPRRYLAPFAAVFTEELAAAVRRDYPGRNVVRRAPPLPPLKE